jgi:hypothetical protein
MIIKEFINFNDSLYIPKHKFMDYRVQENKVHDLRRDLNCDIVLRKDGWLLFCEKIEEAQIIED